MKNMLPKPLKAFFFDFDGVIVESTEIKTHAFLALFSTFSPSIQQQAVAYHSQHQGVSRQKKIRWMYEHVLQKTDLTEAFIEEECEKFSKLVYDKVVDCEEVAGATHLLTQLKQAHIPACLLSATPENELQRIVNKRGLAPYFVEVCGSPRSKVEMGAELMARYGWKPQEILFLGDSLEDYKSATALNVHFIGRILQNKTSPFPDEVMCVQDFVGFYDA